MMAGPWRVLLGSVVLLLLGVSSVGAFGRARGGSAPTPSYSAYAVPVYGYYYCPPALPMMPVMAAPVPGPTHAAPTYAVPTPAPPSQTPEPPLTRPPMPPVKTSESDLRNPTLIAVRSESSPAVDLCRVVFWNLSGRDRTLTIDERAVLLPKDRSITLEVKRRFAWQVNDRPQRLDRVPEGQTEHNIVVRDNR